MRLTKQMKESLYNIIVNKLTNPRKKKEAEFQKKLQDVIYQEHPLLKDFQDKYQISYMFTQTIYYPNITGALLSVKAPTKQILECELGLVGYHDYLPDDIERVAEPYKQVYQEIMDWISEILDYTEILINLKATIDSCTTDTQLREMYPDFVKYFNLAGITTKAVKQLPAKCGLPEKLTKYGLVLQTVEETEKEIKEQQQEGN